MGEPVAVVQKSTRSDDFAVFETNRNFTGMGHETFDSVDQILGDRPVDDLARMLLEEASVSQVHVYAQSVTVKKAAGFDAAKTLELIENFYIYYRPGVEVPTEESFS